MIPRPDQRRGYSRVFDAPAYLGVFGAATAGGGMTQLADRDWPTGIVLLAFGFAVLLGAVLWGRVKERRHRAQLVAEFDAQIAAMDERTRRVQAGEDVWREGR
jgi:hypothetical protein